MKQGEQHHHKYRTLIAFALLIAFLLIVAVWLRLNQPKSDVLGTQTYGPELVEIDAYVPSCILNLKVYPEKRIPPVNNWDTILSVSIYTNTNTLFGSFNTNTDAQGQSLVDLCALGMTPLPGTYNFYIKGFSHLRKAFTNVNTFNTSVSTVDFTTGGRVLLAGETSNVFDNKVNSLDVSTQIRALYSNDYKNDLNQDTKVNSLDLSNTIFNFYKLGD